jgi:hypothetical protein
MTASSAKPKTLKLKARAVVEVPDEGRSYLKLEGTIGEVQRLEWLPMPFLGQSAKFGEFIANRFGYALEREECKAELSQLSRAARRVPTVVGVLRLGWTPDGQVFLYGRRPLPATASVELIAPGGTPWAITAAALEPRGSRDEQLRAFRELWERSPLFRVVLSLACVSPFLELIGAPSLVFHLAGPSGIGKTTVLRLALSAFFDPFSSQTCVDFSKDSKNYADAQLGILHNFPLLIDETTLRSAEDLAEAAYNIAVGHTKARLSGPDRLYEPVASMPYSLVCLLSGESSIRDKMMQRGAAARFIEFPEDQQIIAKHLLPRWNEFAKEHHGWFGLALLSDFADPAARERLIAMYKVGRVLTTAWCDDHSRTADFLAVLQLGHRLAARRLGFDESHEAAEEFAKRIYAKLNHRTRLDDVLERIAARPRAAEFIERGFIPNIDLVGLPDALAVLKSHGLAVKSDSRKVKDQWNGAESVRGVVLTSEGKERLRALVPGEATAA